METDVDASEYAEDHTTDDNIMGDSSDVTHPEVVSMKESSLSEGLPTQVSPYNNEEGTSSHVDSPMYEGDESTNGVNDMSKTASGTEEIYVKGNDTISDNGKVSSFLCNQRKRKLSETIVGTSKEKREW